MGDSSCVHISTTPFFRSKGRTYRVLVVSWLRNPNILQFRDTYLRKSHLLVEQEAEPVSLDIPCRWQRFCDQGKTVFFFDLRWIQGQLISARAIEWL